jgi:uncharacterized protein HemY
MHNQSGSNRLPFVAGFVIVLLVLLALMWLIGGAIL